MSEDKLYSLDVLYNIQNDEEFIKNLIITFLQNIPRSAEELLLATKKQDWQKVFFHAHKIKPSISLFGMDMLAEQLKIVELNAKNREDLDTIPPVVTEIHKKLLLCVSQMKNEFGL